jgi:hypothetical protein
MLKNPTEIKDIFVGVLHDTLTDEYVDVYHETYEFGSFTHLSIINPKDNEIKRL